MAKEEVLVELLIRVNGSETINKLTTFRLATRRQVIPQGTENEGMIEFENKELVKAIKQAVDALL